MIRDILQQYKDESSFNRDLGNRFERLMRAYILNLVKRVIQMSMETAAIVCALPEIQLGNDFLFINIDFA